ncbi:MAG: hypothetical protein H6747_04905 [Deltaproteobacteria bacterium]|nr:hypothetical protein [Deltaproteobacteria bacterium]
MHCSIAPPRDLRVGRDGNVRSRRRLALLAALALVGLVTACADEGADGGAGVVPTSGELHGIWANIEDDEVRAWVFSASNDEYDDLAGKSGVYVVWKYTLGQPQTLEQRGTYAIVDGALRTKPVWDLWYPCDVNWIGACPSGVGKEFSNEIRAFTKEKLRLQSSTATSGERVYNRVQACPAPVSAGAFANRGAPWPGDTYAANGYPTALSDAAGAIHLFTGTAATWTLRHATHAACGWKVEDVADGRPTVSRFLSAADGTLHGVYYALEDNSTHYVVQQDGAWKSELVAGAWMHGFGLLPDATPVVLLASSTAPRLQLGRRTEAGWSFETVVEAPSPAVAASALVVHKDGAIEVLVPDGTAFSRLRRQPDGSWQGETLGVGCDDVSHLHARSDGKIALLCAHTIATNGIVSKSRRFTYVEEQAQGWVVQDLDEALRASLTIPPSGEPTIALLRNGSLGGTNGFNILVGTRGADGWLLRHGEGDGGLVREWSDIAVAVDADGHRWVHAHESSVVTADAITSAGPRSFTLHLTLPSDTPSVTVSSVPAGLQCPGACSVEVPPDTLVRLRFAFDAPASMQIAPGDCFIPAGEDPRVWECRVSVQRADVEAVATPTPAPVIWSTLLGGTADDGLDDVANNGTDIALAGHLGGAGSLGTTTLPGAAGDLVLARMKTSGTVAWARTIAVAQQAATNLHVGLAADGGAFLGLTTTTALQADGLAATQAGATLLRTDGDGKVVAVRALLAAGGGSISEVIGLGDGSVLVAGTFSGGDFGDGDVQTAGGADGFVARLDAKLALVWLRVVGTPSEDGAPRIAADDAGNVVGVVLAIGDVHFDGETKATGLSGSGSWLFALKPDGTLAWSNAESATDLMAPNLVARGADGSLYITTSNGLNFIRKHAVGGALVWSTQAQTGSKIVDLDVAADGKLLTVGTFAGGISKQIGPQATIWSAAGEAEGGGFAMQLEQIPSFGRWLGADLLLGGQTSSGLRFGPVQTAGLGGSDGWLARLPL